MFVIAGNEACAQPGRGGPQPQKLAAEDGTGTIDAIGPGVLRLRLKGGEFWAVVPAPGAQVTVTGAASRQMLQPGQFVSCSLNLDEFGKVTAAPAQVIFPGGGTPGVVAGGIGMAEPGAKRVSGRRPAGTYLVLGTIKTVDDESITVQAGKDRFEIPVPEDVELVVRTSNIALAATGDAVEVEGLYVRRGELQATSLSIKLAQPVSPPSKGRSPPRRPARQPAAAADE
jgi:hypothetical protein